MCSLENVPKNLMPRFRSHAPKKPLTPQLEAILPSEQSETANCKSLFWSNCMCSLPEDLCPNAEDWQRPQLRRRLGDPTPWPRPRWRAASRDRRADGVAAPHPGRDKRLRVVGPLGEPHGVVSSPAAPHPCYGPVGRLVQEQGAVETRSHRDRSHR